MADADFLYMAHAIQLARKGLYTTDPNPRVGCVLVKDDKIIAQGWHQQAGQAHAEINALNNLDSQSVQGATAYVSLEPCCHHGKTPPCSEALIKAGVKRVVIGMLDPNPQVAGKGLQQLQEAGIETRSAVLEEEAKTLNPGFIKRMQLGRPYVRCKIAMSADGRTAMASGESQWITGTDARQDVHKLRARSSAILTGIGTVLADDPSLTARLEAQSDTDGVPAQQPIRVILDPKLLMPVTARMLTLPGKTLIFTHNNDASLIARFDQIDLEIVILEQTQGNLDLQEVLQQLAQREINELMLECGAILNGAFLSAGLVDEIIVYMAPILMGDQARAAFNLPDISLMADKVQLQLIETRSIGKDLRLKYVVAQ